MAQEPWFKQMEGHRIYLEALDRGEVGGAEKLGGPPVATPKIRKSRRFRDPRVGKRQNYLGDYKVVHAGTKEWP